MKTEQLDFLEAVKALEESKCEGIEDERGIKLKLNSNNCLVHRADLLSVYLSPPQILGRWKLIGVRPEKKKIVLENVLWKEFTSGIVYPFIFPPGNEIWETFLDKPKMKMTLEWEE